MTTRTMGRLMLAFGILGWLAGIVASFTGEGLGEDPERIARHLLFSLVPTLALIPVLAWLLVFSLLSRRALMPGRGADGSETANVTRWPMWAGVGGSGLALGLTLGNFFLGFLAVTGDVTGKLHAGVAIAWLIVTAIGLVLAYRSLVALESAADRLAKIGAPGAS